jgi:hypothetical protein
MKDMECQRRKEVWGHKQVTEKGGRERIIRKEIIELN